MYINTFKYTPADVELQTLYREYVKKFGLHRLRLPPGWPERIEAGVVGYAEVVRQMFPPR